MVRLAFIAVLISGYGIGLELEDFIEKSLNPVAVVAPSNYKDFQIADTQKQAALARYCKLLDQKFAEYQWDGQPCGGVTWHMDVHSQGGHPLIYTVFGSGHQTTLVLGGVHPDELTPIPIVFRFARYLSSHPEFTQQRDVKVVVAPLVNPDGFIRQSPARTNANGVDLNRNFLTIDWYSRAISWWRKQKQGEPRRFPGYFPNSEIETLFQVQLIDEYKPDKILSIHAPLGFLDYDGPGDRKPRHLSKTEEKAKQLVHAISRKARNYRVVDYSFYPGSLGNFAGNERNIPTVTLELETTDPTKVDDYWKQFLPGIIQSIEYPFEKGPRVKNSMFLSQYHGKKSLK